MLTNESSLEVNLRSTYNMWWLC